MKLRDFVYKGVIKMIGNEPDYKVIRFALNWFDKGVLEAEDLEKINNLLGE